MYILFGMPQCHLPVLPPTVMDVLVTPVLMQCILVVPSPQDTLLKGILQIVEANMDLEPLHFLSFPIVLGAPTAAGASPGPRQNGTAGGGGKGVGLLWKGKLSPRRDAARKHAAVRRTSSLFITADIQRLDNNLQPQRPQCTEPLQ